jgi:hypothetical protein
MLNHRGFCARLVREIAFLIHIKNSAFYNFKKALGKERPPIGLSITFRCFQTEGKQIRMLLGLHTRGAISKADRKIGFFVFRCSLGNTGHLLVIPKIHIPFMLGDLQPKGGPHTG